MIGNIPDRADAERFGDYLVAQGIDNDIEPAGDEWAVWVHHDDHLDRANEALADFRKYPRDARYADVKSTARKVRQQREQERQRLRKHYVDVRTNWHGRSSGARPLTAALMILSVLITMAAQFGRADNALTAAMWFGQEPPFELILQGQVWRLITPIFLHLNWLHLVFNMFWLYDLGGTIERRKSSWWLLVMVLIIAAISSSAQAWTVGPGFGGFSGVVYGLFGYIWVKSKHQPYEQLALGSNTVIIMMVWLVICMTGAVGPIANTAHVVGLIVGAALGASRYYWLKLTRKSTAAP